MKPLQLETSRSPDQVHVACVVDLKPKLFEPRFGVPRVDVELRKEQNAHQKDLICSRSNEGEERSEPYPPLQPVDCDVVGFVGDVERHQTQVGEIPEKLRRNHKAQDEYKKTRLTRIRTS